MNYAKILYKYTVARGKDSVFVSGVTRQQMATACGVDLNALEDKSTFLAWNIKKQVVRRLQADELEADRVAIKAAFNTLAEENGLVITRWTDGDSTDGLLLKVRRAE